MNFVRIQWNEVGNIAVAGDTGSGKTNTACFLAAQVVLAGGQLIVCDPHGNAPEQSREQTLSWNISPLAASFVCDVAISDDAIKESIYLTNDILQSRRRGASATYPVWLVIDEFSGVMRNHDVADALSSLLEDIATEGRKFFVGVMIAGQQWHTSRSGGGELRSVLNVAIIHKMKRHTANLLLNLGKHLPDTYLLGQGEAYLYRNAITRIQIPRVTRADLAAVVRTSSDEHPQLIEQTVPVAHQPRDATHQRIVELFEREKRDVSDIAREVFAVKSGPPYQRALAAVNDALRQEYSR